jgi:radial spoke head protein 4A
MGTSNIALERVQALLKVDTGSGSLYDHLIRVVRKLSEDKPDDALAQLETLSRHLKQANFRGEAAPDEGKAVSVDAAAEELRQMWCADSVKLVRPPASPMPVLAAVQNYLEDAAMFEWAGVGFGKQESYHIAMSMRRLATDTPSLDSLRLWGKILGTQGDYYVAEGTLQAAGEGPSPPPFVLPGTAEYDVEPRGEGPNTCAYWVAKSPTAPWVRLPAARASHIVAARNVQRIMTGDLASPVLTAPWFPGEERHLLRAQIARITATCKLAVKGWLEVDPDKGDGKLMKIVEDPLGSFPSQEELDGAGGWTHAAHFLLQTGRSRWPDLDAISAAREENPTLISEKELADMQDAKDNKDTEHECLETIEADLDERKPDDVESTVAWQFKSHGDKGIYNKGDISHRLSSVRSLIWPGAISVAQGKKYANLYVGYGLKCGTLVPGDKASGLPLPLKGTCPFSPLEPAEIMEEPNDLEEYEEPNPLDKDAESDKGSMDGDEDA